MEIICEPTFELSRHANTMLTTAHDTLRITTVVEGWIRQHPAQWLWLHNRWKRRSEPPNIIYEPATQSLTRA